MTKDEKIAELLSRYVEDAPKIELDLYKDEEWGTATIECSNENELYSLKQRVFSFVAGWIEKTINKTGVFELLICVPHKGEFDSSEEANQRRHEINELQNRKMEEIRKGLAEIESQYAEEPKTLEAEIDEETKECH